MYNIRHGPLGPNGVLTEPFPVSIHWCNRSSARMFKGEHPPLTHHFHPFPSALIRSHPFSSALISYRMNFARPKSV